MTASPDLLLSADDRTAFIALRDQLGSLESIEDDLLGPRAIEQRLQTVFSFDLRSEAVSLWEAHDHFVIRNVPSTEDGSTGLLIAALLFRKLKKFGTERVVKHFKMSPWTTALSHTLAEGTFHTDVNTATEPPAATITQCITRDPDAPNHGQLRVSRFHDLLTSLRSHDRSAAFRFLTSELVVMVNDASSTHWSGRIYDGSAVRFHPATLRAAQRRYGSNPPDLDDLLQDIHEAALSVSRPIDLAEGDLLVVSNRRALHQRGACTVRFRSFPRDFESRSVAVLHAMDDLA
jgi:hypothetical protein